MKYSRGTFTGKLGAALLLGAGVVSGFGCNSEVSQESPLAAQFGLTVSTAASAGTAGTCVGVTVSLIDANGVAMAATADVPVSLNVSGGSPFTDTNCSNSGSSLTIVAGATSVDASVKSLSAGSLAVSASSSDPNATLAGSGGSINYTAGVASKLEFTQLPSLESGCTVFATQPKVAITDAYGNVITSDSSSLVSLSLYSGSDTNCSGSAVSGLSGITATASGGVATFSSTLQASNAGSVRLGATAGALSGCSSAFSISSSGGKALVFSTEPSAAAAAGVAFSTQPAVSVVDACGLTVTNASDSVTLAAYSDASCSVSKSGTGVAGTVAASSGVASFSGRSFSASGALSLKATSGSLTGACSSTVFVAPGAATQLAKFAGDSQSAAVSTVLPTNPKVQVKDAYGNGVPGEVVTFTASAGGAVSAPTGASNLNGYAEVAHTLNSTPGSNSLVVNATSFVGSVTFSSTALSVSGVAKLAVSGPSVLTSGTTGLCSPAYSVTAENAANGIENVTSDTTVTLGGIGSATVYSDSACSASNPIVILANSGSAKFYLRDAATESLSIQATSGSLTAANTLSVSVTAFTMVQNFQVNSGYSTQIKKAVDASDGSLILVGQATSNTSVQTAMVWKSADNGSTLSTLDSWQLSSGKNSQYMWISKDASGNLYAAGYGVDSNNTQQSIVRKSSNNGSTWTTIFTASTNTSFNNFNGASGVVFNSQGHIFVLHAYYSTGLGLRVSKSTDGGATWNVVNTYVYPATAPTMDNIFIPILAIDSGDNLYYSMTGIDDTNTDHGIVRRSTDGGNTWATVDDYLPIGSTKHTYGISVAFDPNTGDYYTIGQTKGANNAYYGYVRKSSSGASGTWTTTSLYQEVAGQYTNYRDIAFAPGKIYVALGAGLTSTNRVREMRVSYDGGYTFSPIDYFAPSPTTASGGNNVMVRSNGTLLHYGQISNPDYGFIRRQ